MQQCCRAPVLGRQGFARPSSPALPARPLLKCAQRSPLKPLQAAPERGPGPRTSQQDPLRGLEVAVPQDQRPSRQLAELKSAQLYSWDYVVRLAGIFAFFFAFIGGPISFQTFDPLEQPAEWALSGAVGSLVVVAIVVLRIYLGWSYIGDRLMSAAVEYEETGWYDGEVFVKPPEVLTRDRLLGMYEVKPVVAKLRQTLLGSGAVLLACAVVLSSLITAGADEDGMYGRSARKRQPVAVTPNGVIFSKQVTDLSQLAYDDELAAAEAAAAGDVPGYCRDRLLRAAAGGNGCAKYDGF